MTTKVSTKRHYEVCVTLDEIKELAAKKLGRYIPNELPAIKGYRYDFYIMAGYDKENMDNIGTMYFKWEEEVND